MKSGAFIISLDFELYWGFRDRMPLDQCKARFQSAARIVPLIINTFAKYEIHATWATVGFIFAQSTRDLKKFVPQQLPTYLDPNLSPYNLLEQNHLDSYREHLIAPELIKLIASTPHQEIGSHSLSHYYCNEAGQTLEQFDADTKKAIEVFKINHLAADSYVFARNQYSADYVNILALNGFKCFRGTETSWPYRSLKNKRMRRFQRPFRYMDRFLNITGDHVYCPQKQNNIVNLPASAFLSPVTKSKILDHLRYKRITNSMSQAAFENKIYHLWWHPHNFNENTEENLEFLEKILQHFKTLEENYKFKSLNMSEASQWDY